MYSEVISIRKIRPTSGCSRIATAPFFKYFLLAKLVYNVTGRAGPQSAEPQAFEETFVLQGGWDLPKGE